MCTSRPNWKSISFQKPTYKSSCYNVNVDLRNILEIDTNRRIIRVEPLVTIEKLTTTLEIVGWTIPVVPDLDELTVGK